MKLFLWGGGWHYFVTVLRNLRLQLKLLVLLFHEYIILNATFLIFIDLFWPFLTPAIITLSEKR